MQVEQKQWTADAKWQDASKAALTEKAQLVLAFGARKLLAEQKLYKEIKKMHPKAEVVICSTAGEILGSKVADNSVSLSALNFAATEVKAVQAKIEVGGDSHQVGLEAAAQLVADDLAHVLVFSDGLRVNGSALAKGIISQLPEHVSVTGGLVGDSADFQSTLVGLNDEPQEGQIVLVGLYGQAIKAGFGSVGGWNPFGPERTITKSKDNILFELDGKPALKLYKEYLGDEAKDLPGSGLLFPLMIKTEEKASKCQVVRTLLAVDEESQSMTFAGDIPQGAIAQLMSANTESLIDGAAEAAKRAREGLGGAEPDFALLISCVGRKLVLKSRTDEEVEVVGETLGHDTALAGFYSYGELCPFSTEDIECRLHNQTMTITALREEA